MFSFATTTRKAYKFLYNIRYYIWRCETTKMTFTYRYGRYNLVYTAIRLRFTLINIMRIGNSSIKINKY